MREAEAAGQAGLADALARTLGDPSLQVVFWLPGQHAYVDADGSRVALPAAGAGRAAAEITSAGHRVGAIVRLARTGGHLVAKVGDDGIGGADLDRGSDEGSGLRGLADRVEALGGLAAVRQPSRCGYHAGRGAAVFCADLERVNAGGTVLDPEVSR